MAVIVKQASSWHFFSHLPQAAVEIPLAFIVAWLVARLARALASKLIEWHYRFGHRGHDGSDTAQIAGLKRQETAVIFIRGVIIYLAFAGAAVFSISALFGGLSRLATILGTSFVLATLVFASQRFLADLLAGLSLFFGGWYSVGDTVHILPHDLKGVVEDINLRGTKLRALNGELIHINNSKIDAVRRLPRGVKDLAVEIYVCDADAGAALIEESAALLVESPTMVVRRPTVVETEVVSDTLHRVRAVAGVAPGREWLIEEHFCSLLQERASEGLLTHDPLIFAVDEKATQAYARSSSPRRVYTSRRQR